MSAGIHPDSSIRLLTADDHTMVRTGLQMLLKLKFGIADTFEAASCAEVLSALREYRPTHLIIDMVFKDGNSMEILPTVTSLAPELNIMVYSMLPTEVYMPALQKFGIRHYLNKDSSQQATITMLNKFLYELNTASAARRSLVAPEHPFVRLSARELEVLHYILKGESVTFTADALNLHKNTVSTLKKRIFEKIGVKNTKGLLDMAALHNYGI